jgi:hypothetical protein
MGLGFLRNTKPSKESQFLDQNRYRAPIRAPQLLSGS